MVFTPLGKKVSYKLPVQNFATESLQEMDYMYYPLKTLTVCDFDNSSDTVDLLPELSSREVTLTKVTCTAQCVLSSDKRVPSNANPENEKVGREIEQVGST